MIQSTLLILGVSEETGESETQASLLQAQLSPLKQELSNKDQRIAELVRQYYMSNPIQPNFITCQTEYNCRVYDEMKCR